MEAIRRRMAAAPDLYPELAKKANNEKRTPREVISIASSGSSTVASPPAHEASGNPRPKLVGVVPRPIVLSSDSEDDLAPVAVPKRKPKPPTNGPPQLFSDSDDESDNGVVEITAVSSAPVSKSTEVASSRDSPAIRETDNDTSQNIHIPDFADDNRILTPDQAKEALQNIFDDTVNDEPGEVYTEEDITVPGMKDIRLLPHQVRGRRFMASREDPSEKRFGGILADDMGLGKTVQALTRIVEGKPKQADKELGWAPTTLVVCPLALLAQWKEEIETKTDKLTVSEHHGPKRTSDPRELTRKRVVLTTYDVVRSEYDAYQKMQEGGTRNSKVKDALFRVKWFRIFLDEAHTIKNRTSKGSIASCNLKSKYKWALTGTPMQNDVSELYPLLCFLNIKPLSNWQLFNEQIAKPIKNGKGAARAMKRLQVVLKVIMLRRKKTDLVDGKPLLHLPARNVQVVTCKFDVGEKAFYDALEGKMQEVLEKLLEQSGGKAYMSALLLLLRLRQACNHPALVSKDYKADIQGLQSKPAEGQDLNNDVDELADVLGNLGVQATCQLCQQELTEDNVSEDDSKHCRDCANLALRSALSEDEEYDSAKIRMIIKLLEDIKARANGEEKTIIFSQFTSMLDLIQPFLHKRGIRFVRYDGAIKKPEREEALRMIKTDARTKVILISFKAGSTGLNLTACNNVILVDLWWNPALEDQAFDRAHRMGQTRDVNIYKLKIDETVEERILALQDRKRLLAAAALSGELVKGVNRLGMKDLLDLFRASGHDSDEEDFENY